MKAGDPLATFNVRLLNWTAMIAIEEDRYRYGAEFDLGVAQIFPRYSLGTTKHAKISAFARLHLTRHEDKQLHCNASYP